MNGGRLMNGECLDFLIISTCAKWVRSLLWSHETILYHLVICLQGTDFNEQYVTSMYITYCINLNYLKF